MPIEIKMPALSPTMEEGNLSKWLVGVGDTVEAGDVIAEIETDKATMEVESADEGKVGRIVVPEGTEGVAVGALIAVLLEEGEDASAAENVKAEAPAKAAEPPEEKKAPEKKQEKKPEKTSPVSSPTQANLVSGDPDARLRGHDSSLSSGRIKASPLARRIAGEKGVDLAAISGSGPGGRIIKADVEGATGKPAAGIGQTPVSGELEPPREEVPVNNVRKIVAKRLVESVQTIPHYYLTIEANITRLLEMRKQVNEGVEGAKLSVNDFVIKAVALALMKTPEAHVQWAGDKMYRFGRADVSVAVAIDGGLITPIVRGADQKPMKEISVEMKGLAAKAKEGKLKPEEYQGGTFSISNLGMFGIKEFTAVINPPQSGILAVGAGEQRPVVINGEVEIQSIMAMTGSFDHRAVDGAVGAVLMKNIKELLEAPAILLY